MQIKLANPRGFCAGVDRAIEIVNRALEVFGPPIYVRHEVVHNKFVVDDLRHRGAVFVDELDQVPDDGVVIFSAHGVSKAVQAEAARRGLRFVLDTSGAPLRAALGHGVALTKPSRGEFEGLVGRTLATPREQEEAATHLRARRARLAEAEAPGSCPPSRARRSPTQPAAQEGPRAGEATARWVPRTRVMAPAAAPAAGA